MSTQTGWTVETLKEHYDAILRERGEALKATLAASEKALAVLAEAYQRDKAQQNEWRGTVNDIISKLGGKDEGATDLWKIIASVVGVAVTVGSVLYAILK